jgi:iron complex outermembrane receptor protein
MKLKTIVGSLALLGLATHAVAQTVPAKPERIVITGSSIKRIAAEGALPVQIITAEEIEQQGLVTAQDLLGSLGANSANTNNEVSSNTVFGPDQDRLTGGAAFANLRGLGPTGTLVLLNGRRISTHGQSGSAVDLNAIPMSAIARVEVLKDGASAIYGTDAIGGVINFILKSNYRGAAIGGTISKPEADGGGGARRATLSFGFGDLDTDGWNFLSSVTFDKTQILRGVDREWATGYQPGRQLSPETTSAPHANIIAATGTALGTAGTVVGTTDTTRYTNLNLLAIQGQCEAMPFGTPLAANVTLWDRFGYTNANSRYRCGTDYGRQFMLRAPRESWNVVARGQVKIARDHVGFLELVGSRTEIDGEYTPFQFSSTSNALTNLRPTSPHYLDMRALVGATQFDPTLPIAYRLRMNDWGYRTNTNKSENTRIALGAEGDFGAYSYRVGASSGQAKGDTYLKQGYAFTQKLVDALATGTINPFLNPGEEQTAEAKALIESTQARGRVFGGKTSVTQFDGSVSGPLMKLPAGILDFAVGFDSRKEGYEFSGSQGFTCVSIFTVANAALPNSVMGCPGNARSPKLTRDINAVFAELAVPVFKSLSMQLAVRHDNYSQIGGTTNPKIALRWQPTNNFILRASANTGFRAPTPQQLNLGTVELALTGTFRDPVRCADPANPIDPTQCTRSSLPYRQGGNPTLQPETSKQALIGFAFQPLSWFSVGMDYWQVNLDDRIRQLSPALMIANYDLFRDNFIRDANGNVAYIQAGWVNAAQSETKGLDFNVTGIGNVGGGRLTAKLNGTKMISHKERLIASQPLQQFVGKWSNVTLYLPWRIDGSVGFKKGDWNTTLSARWSSSYDDENRAPYTVNQPTSRTVEPYFVTNLFTTFSGVKNLTVTAGVINLFDKEPPYTWHNVDNVIGAGWDPRVADPRGRTVQVSFGYKFF